MTKNNRGSTRIDLEVEVSFESEHNFYTGFSQNISGGGLFVSTSALQPIGSLINIRFKLATHQSPVEVEAIVRWIRDMKDTSGMGLQFTRLTDDARQAIDAFIGQRDAIFYDDE